jgi:DegV family protein with EDD domain
MAAESRPVKVVTDSAADIPPEVAADLDITIVPLLIHIGGKTYRDGVDLSGERFYQELAAARSVTTTSFPSLQDFSQAYIALIEQGCDVVGVHVSSKLSGTYDAALMASTADGVTPDAVNIVDSRSVCMSQGWVAIEAAEAARAGKNLAEVTEVAENAARRTILYGALETLEYAVKSGRIGKLPGSVGTMLSIKPIIALRPNGEVALLERVRTRARSIERLVELAAARGSMGRLAVMHAADPDGASHLKELVVRHGMPEPEIVAHIGAVLGTHVGPGGVGICALLEQSE